MGSTVIKVHVNEVSPTQACIGGFEVELKTDRFRLMAPSDVQGYLDSKRDKGKAVRMVRGPSRFYLIDGHHTLSAIVRAQDPGEVQLDLVGDHSDVRSEDEYWERMRDEGLYYPRRLGEAVSPTDFPKRVEDLADDPYRSVAWLVRKMGAFEDLKQPFQEFKIADFLRQHMAFEPRALPEYELAAIRACELLRSGLARAAAEAGDLPGVDPDDDLPDDLLDCYYEVLAKARAPRIYR